MLNLKLIMEPIVSRVSYQDHKLFLFVFTVGRDVYLALNNSQSDPWLRSSSNEAPEAGEELLPLKPRIQNAPVETDRLSTFSTPLLTRTVLQQAHNVLQMKADFVVKGISFKLINDCADYNVPVMDVILSPMVLQFRDWFTPLGTLVAAPIELSAFYYNNKLSIWEPFVEPWDFDLRVNALVSTRSHRGHKVSITSKKRLDFVVTHTLLEILHHTVTSIRSDLGAGRRDLRSDSSPCLIR